MKNAIVIHRSQLVAGTIALALTGAVIALVSMMKTKAAVSPQRPPPLTPGTMLVVPQSALPTGAGPGGGPALLSTPPVPLTMGTMSGNVHVRIQRMLAPDRAVGVVLAIESTNDTPPFQTTLSAVSGEPTIDFDPRSARPATP